MNLGRRQPSHPLGAGAGAHAIARKLTGVRSSLDAVVVGAVGSIDGDAAICGNGDGFARDRSAVVVAGLHAGRLRA